MPENLVTGGVTISCPHGGRVAPAVTPSSGVRSDGWPVFTERDVFRVQGCWHTVNGVPRPCVTVRWAPERDRVLIDGAPVLLHGGDGLCFDAALLPQGRPVLGAAARGVCAA